MPSLANFHKERVKNRGHIPKSHDKSAATGQPAEKNELWEKMKLDVAHASSINSHKERNAYKADRLKLYKDHAVMWLRSGKKTPNPVVSWYLVWLVDTGEIEEFTAFCPRAIAAGQVCPEGFRRDLITFYYDSIEQWVRHEFKKGNNGKRPYLDRALERLVGEDKGKINEELEARMWVWNAKLLFTFERDNPQSVKEAIESCGKAIQVYPVVQVKTMLNRLKKIYEKQHPAGEPADEQEEATS